MLCLIIRHSQSSMRQEIEEKLTFWKNPIPVAPKSYCSMGYEVTFLVIERGGKYFEIVSLVLGTHFHTRGIYWYASHDHTTLQNGYSSGNRKKSIFSRQKMRSFWQNFRPSWKYDKFFSIPKKIGWNFSKFQILAFEQIVIDVLSGKARIISIRQVEPSIEHQEWRQWKRLLKALGSYSRNTK